MDLSTRLRQTTQADQRDEVRGWELTGRIPWIREIVEFSIMNRVHDSHSILAALTGRRGD
jgi:hypothetical protein